MRAYRTHLLLDIPLSDRDKIPYIDRLEAPNYIPYNYQILQSSLKQRIGELLADLSKREEQILRMRFGFYCNPTTLESIGKAIDLSRERVRQIGECSKEKLTAKSKACLLRDEM